MPMPRIVLRVGHEVVAQINDLHRRELRSGVSCSKAEIMRRALRLGLASLRQRVEREQEDS